MKRLHSLYWYFVQRWHQSEANWYLQQLPLMREAAMTHEQKALRAKSRRRIAARLSAVKR